MKNAILAYLAIVIIILQIFSIRLQFLSHKDWVEMEDYRTETGNINSNAEVEFRNYVYDALNIPVEASTKPLPQ